jgi:hypothetical protein
MPLAGQPPITTFQSPGSGLGLPPPQQVFESPQFIAPQEIFLPPKSAGFVGNHPTTVPSGFTELPAITNPLDIAPGQAVVSPAVTELSLVTPSPVLGPSQAVMPDKGVASSTLVETHTVYPLIEPSQPAAPDQPVVSPLVAGSPLVTPSPVLGSSLPMVTAPPLPIPLVVESLQNVASQSTVVLHRPTYQQRVADPSPNVIDEPQTTVVPRTSDLTKDTAGSNSGSVVASKTMYKIRDKGGATARRDSIEGITLFLGESGYQFATPLVAPTASSTTLPLDDFVVASSQQPVPTTPSADEFIVPSSQQSLEEPLTIPTTTTTTNDRPSFAPRIIPNITIDRSDFPSWLLERGRFDFVLAVEAGDTWEKLITTWLRQERRVSFGLKDGLVSRTFLCALWYILKVYCRERAYP